MSLITLTSDLGDSSHYPAIVKGVIYSLYAQARIVDLNHNVPNFDIMEAAFMLQHTYPAYPPGSIHLVAVDPEPGLSPEGIAVACDGHFFIGPNNGVLSLVCEGKPAQSVAIAHEGLLKGGYPRSFRAARLFAPTAAFLASGGQLDEIGPSTPLRDLRWGEPTYASNCLRGKIIHIDKFGNAITNIRRGNFLQIKQDRRFEIFIRSVRLRRIVNTYSDVAKADALAIFGEGEQLEIAMREASAAELLGLKVHDMITIEFSS
jgi:S-adenosyl-L-methionine hydrolase (adenosine-forming)